MKNEELRNEECARRGLDVIGTFFFETQKEQKAQKVFTKGCCIFFRIFNKKQPFVPFVPFVF